MSITVRLWKPEELKQAKDGEDLWLSTLLMNETTFSQEEIRAYPYRLRKEYLCHWPGHFEPVKVYAPNDEMLLKFIDAEYRSRPQEIVEVIKTHRRLKFTKKTKAA